MARSIRSKVIIELQNLPFADSTYTANALKGLIGGKLSSLSSVLCRMAKKGEIVRVPEQGPRGGYGYRLKTVSETVDEWKRNGGLERLRKAAAELP